MYLMQQVFLYLSARTSFRKLMNQWAQRAEHFVYRRFARCSAAIGQRVKMMVEFLALLGRVLALRIGYRIAQQGFRRSFCLG